MRRDLVVEPDGAGGLLHYAYQMRRGPGSTPGPR